MIVLDTNVVSEPMKADPSPVVLAWLDGQVAETLYLTTTSLAELMVGVACLPAGRRKHGLAALLTELLDRLFGTRILPFDREAVIAYADLVSRAQARGRAMSVADGQIAAIAAVHGCSVATRDSGPFLSAGLVVIDPWESE